MLKLPLSISGGDVLLIVPPFAVVNRTSLGLHILQACAKEAGFTVSVLYANIIFAADIGMKAYMAICTAPFQLLAGERSFARSAYGVPPLGWNADRAVEAYTAGEVSSENGAAQLQTKYNVIKLGAAAFKDLEARANQWVEEVAAAIAAGGYKVVGCTTMFEQTAASIALLNRVKQRRPEVVTIIGGPNCEGEMAEGIAGLSQAIDYIFSGESEETFVAFLAELFAGKRPAKRIIYGQPCQDLDALPVPDFQEYYEQLDHYLPAVAAKAGSVELTYETSRGCWWGQKHHCTFCGLNGMGMGFREKSAGKVITELKQLLAQHPYPTHLVQMTDNIMPYTFFKTLVPELAGLAVEMPTLRLYYEQKANLSLEQVLALMKAGITHIQPGIEALSTSLLKRMDKGVTAAQNIALLRYAHSVGMRLDWNLLWGFPGDTREEYEETLALLPLLHHLEPPISAHHLRIDRFSPYFDRPEAYSITNLRPLPSYQMILPPGVDPFKVAYHFTGDYESESHTKPDIIEEIEREMAAWQANWDEKNTHITLFFGKFKIKELPILEVTQRENGFFLLRDTRGLPGTETEYRLSHEQASVALVPRRFLPTPEMAWALEHKVGVVLDTHQYVPLATASPELLQEFEAEVRREKSKQPLFEKIIPLTPSRAQESRW